MTVTEAVSSELEEFERRVPGLGSGALAAMALSLAADMDDPHTGSTSRSMVSKELRDTLAALRALAPARTEGSPLDEIRARRDAKVARQSGAEAKARSGRGGTS